MSEYLAPNITTEWNDVCLRIYLQIYVFFGIYFPYWIIMHIFDHTCFKCFSRDSAAVMLSGQVADAFATVFAGELV